MLHCTDADLKRDWNYLQSSDHFYYMSTKWFSDGAVHHYFNPYGSPYEAFLNYMNVLADFLIRVREYAENEPVPELKVLAKKAPATKEKITSITKVPGEKELKTKAAVTAKLQKKAETKPRKK
jgi:alpha-amylase